MMMWWLSDCVDRVLMCEEDADQVSSRVKGWFHNILSLTFESSADKVRAKGTFQYRPRAPRPNRPEPSRINVGFG